MPDDQLHGVLRRLLLAHGFIALLAGVLLLVWPDRTLLLVALVLGIYLVLHGVFGTIRALTAPGLLTMERVVPAILGLLATAAGAIVIARPSGSVLAVALAAGIYLIVAGLAAGVSAIREPSTRSINALTAVVNLVGGILVVVWPDVSVKVVAIALGIALVLRGAIEILASFLIKESPVAP